MKYYILKALTNKLDTYQNIKLIKRVSNNTIKIEFDKKNIYYFDLSKGNSLVYKKDANFEAKDFNAPFDVLLQKKFNGSKINKTYLHNDDKIINIEVLSRSAYKNEIVTLQLEFTGKYTNIIILDEKRVVLEALRHVDEDISSRIVRVGQVLEDIPKANFTPKIEPLEDIDSFLYNLYNELENKQLQNLKKQKISLIEKSIKKIQKILLKMQDVEELKNEAKEIQEKAQLILANLHQIKPYQKEIELYDFEGNLVKIILEKNEATPSVYANKLFKHSKKLKQKASHQYIEQENLEQKLFFFKRLITTIQGLKTIDEIEFYFPKKDKNQSKTKKEQPYQSFFVDSYKIMLGRDERENIYLLENSRASDFWFHLKDRHSCHVIVKNTKKNLPQNIIETAAQICARFSSNFGGDYLVDYTQRRNVKVQNKANVLYNPYTTIKVVV
ncbi:MAG: NFACT RNA binding domain-containing protein [Sphaerochaetaceae bacterium]|nr:NFACT RNA binding domain-containing protein [Sphaerochaetaceae bacterium]